VRRQSPQDAVLGGSVPMLLRTSKEASSGMKIPSAHPGKALQAEKRPLVPQFLLG
jgi:hypothetical protein